MSSGPITSRQIEEWQVEAVTDFTFLVFKIFVDGNCSHEIKGCLLLASKVMTNLDRVLKSRHLVLPTKVCIVKAMVCTVVIYRYESCNIKKAKCQRIEAFKLWCWRRLLRVPWTAKRSNQSVVKEINPEYSLEGLMLNLKLQYFGYLNGRTNSLGKKHKTLMLGSIEGKRRRGQQWRKWLDSITNSMDTSLSKLCKGVKDIEACVLQFME